MGLYVCISILFYRIFFVSWFYLWKFIGGYMKFIYFCFWMCATTDIVFLFLGYCCVGTIDFFLVFRFIKSWATVVGGKEECGNMTCMRLFWIFLSFLFKKLELKPKWWKRRIQGINSRNKDQLQFDSSKRKKNEILINSKRASFDTFFFYFKGSKI